MGTKADGSTAVPLVYGLRFTLSNGNYALLLFIILSLSVAMSVSQEEAPEPGSVRYWLLVIPALLLPATNLVSMTRTLLGRGVWMLVFLLVAGTWQLARGDTTAFTQLFLLVWVTTWISSDVARLKVKHIERLYLVMVFVGCLVYLRTDLNPWGPLPGLTLPSYGVWRVSFFPNIAFTALLSLLVIMVITRERVHNAGRKVLLAIAAYFLIASFVRAALIALFMYIALRWWFAREPTPRRLFWSALLVGIGVNFVIASSPFFFEYLQNNSFVSRLFLRGETQLSAEEIYQQLYRPWLWVENFKQFAASPWLMGWGTFNFNDLKSTELIEGLEQSDSVSLLTRLLAIYGLPGALFTVYLVVRLRAAALARDSWACACFAPVLLLTLHWGSAFHPSNALFALFLMAVIRGSDGFVESSRHLYGPRSRSTAK